MFIHEVQTVSEPVHVAQKAAAEHNSQLSVSRYVSLGHYATHVPFAVTRSIVTPFTEEHPVHI